VSRFRSCSGRGKSLIPETPADLALKPRRDLPRRQRSIAVGFQVDQKAPLFKVVLVPSIPMYEVTEVTSGSFSISSTSCDWREAIAA